jgi:hypothetical protein
MDFLIKISAVKMFLPAVRFFKMWLFVSVLVSYVWKNNMCCPLQWRKQAYGSAFK